MTIHSLKKKIIRVQARRAAAEKKETRDGILWDIIPEQKIARVKVLGSNNLIECKYPENWQQKPMWMKPRTAVRIQHRGGNRNSYEIVGDGLFVPTPTINSVTGISNPALPDIPPGVDTILTEGLVYALETPGMQVWVKRGTYRIDGVFYTMNYMEMDAGSVADMSSGVPMGETAGVFDINAAHSTLWRMDKLVIGADKVIDVLTGDNAISAPEAPATPSGHIELDTVLVPPGTTEIVQTLIGREFLDPYVALIEVTSIDGNLYWAEETTAINLTVRDQYGNPIIGSALYISCSITSGSGSLSTGLVSVNPLDGTASLTYTREEGYAESSANIEEGPVFLNFVLSSNSLISMISYIVLYDEAGDPII